MSTKIEWTQDTWNPLIGCTKVSAGCMNCYAIRTAWIRQHNPKMEDRYAGIVTKTKGGKLNWTGKVNLVPDALDKPVKKKKPTMYFVNSMSDLFHPAVSFEFIDKVISTISWCPQHTFQVLTKQPARMLEYFKSLQERTAASPEFLPLPNLWMGVSVENQQAMDERFSYLLQIPAVVRFLSCEPLLGPVIIPNTKKLHWVIVGGESGPGARPMHPNWARSLRDQCQGAGVAFFFKQWGEWHPYRHGDCSRFDFGTFADKPSDWPDLEVGAFSPVLGLNWGTPMSKPGKRASGRILDGTEHNSFPEYSNKILQP